MGARMALLCTRAPCTIDELSMKISFRYAAQAVVRLGHLKLNGESRSSQGTVFIYC